MSAKTGIVRHKRPARVAYLEAYRTTPEYIAKKKAALRKHRTGMDQAMFDALMVLQDGKCAVCNRDLSVGRGTHADHDHDTKKPRGLLCRNCNVAEGEIKNAGLTPHGYADRLQAYLDNPPVDLLELA